MVLLLFLTLAGAVVGGLHYYFWIRLVRDTQLSGLSRQASTWALIALAALAVATPTLGRAVPPVGRVLAWPGMVWLGAMFVLFVVLLGFDLGRLLVNLITRMAAGAHPFDPSRRVFNTRLLAGAALTGVSGVTAAAVRATRADVAVKRVEIALDRLPANMDGTKIVQLCDLHIGGLLRQDFVERVVATTNDLNPDIVAIVGDLVDGRVEKLLPVIAPMTNFKTRYGAYFVTGNHEYYTGSGARAWMDAIDGLGLRVLRNQHVSIGPANSGFDLAGVHDHGALRFPEQGPGEDVGQSLFGRDSARPVVLLAHQPVTIHSAARHGVDLQLSGHTHGGQIWPWGALVRLQQPFIRGLHRVGGTQIYISCGTGYWGPPMRLGAPAEITEIVLRARKSREA